MILLIACAAPAFPDPATALVAEFDVDGSGDLSHDEMPGPEFRDADADGDNRLQVDEVRIVMDRRGPGRSPGAQRGKAE